MDFIPVAPDVRAADDVDDVIMLLAFMVTNPFRVHYLFELLFHSPETRRLMERKAPPIGPLDDQQYIPKDEDLDLWLTVVGNKLAVKTRQFIAKYQRILTVLGEVFKRSDFSRLNVNCVVSASGFVVCFDRRGSLFSAVRASCKANCSLQSVWKNGVEYVIMVANVDIPEGKELTVDFNYAIDYGYPTMVCNCGEKKCRIALAYRKDKVNEHFCQPCNRSFDTTQLKSDHIIIVHVHGGAVKCPMKGCGCTFTHIPNYYRHLKEDHKCKEPFVHLRNYRCKRCNHKNKTPTQWLIHDQKCAAENPEGRPCDCPDCQQRPEVVQELPVVVEENEEQALFDEIEGQQDENEAEEEEVCGNEVEDDVCGDQVENEACGDHVEDEVCGDQIEDDVCGNEVEENVCGDQAEDDVCGNEVEENVCGDQAEDDVCGDRIADIILGYHDIGSYFLPDSPDDLVDGEGDNTSKRLVGKSTEKSGTVKSHGSSSIPTTFKSTNPSSRGGDITSKHSVGKSADKSGTVKSHGSSSIPTTFKSTIPSSSGPSVREVTPEDTADSDMRDRSVDPRLPTGRISLMKAHIDKRKTVGKMCRKHFPVDRSPYPDSGDTVPIQYKPGQVPPENVWSEASGSSASCSNPPIVPSPPTSTNQTHLSPKRVFDTIAPGPTSMKCQDKPTTKKDPKRKEKGKKGFANFTRSQVDFVRRIGKGLKSKTVAEGLDSLLSAMEDPTFDDCPPALDFEVVEGSSRTRSKRRRSSSDNQEQTQDGSPDPTCKPAQKRHFQDDRHDDEGSAMV